MSSAPVGLRIVARALPGSGGSAARARASAACLAAWRAAQGAAPRRPSFRLSGDESSFPAPPLGGAGFAGAACFVEALVAAGFFVFAMSLSVRAKPSELLGFAHVSPPAAVGLSAGVTRTKRSGRDTRCQRRASTREMRGGARGAGRHGTDRATPASALV